jgi:LysR family transcriptional regulator, glycine cleavage system transcriptional activator
MNLPSLQSLICFEAAARLSSFSEAAKSVCLTPAAVSQRIRQLEEQLGVELFHRGARTVRLTDAGIQLLTAARACISAAEACVEAAQATKGPPPQEVTIGTGFEIGLSWVTPSIARLEETLPQLTTHLYFGAPADFLARLKAMEIDCAVTSMRILDPAFEWIPLFEERCIFVGAASLLEKIPFEKPDDAMHHTILDIRPTLSWFQHLVDAPGYTPLKFARLRSFGLSAAVRRMVLEGRGVAVLPAHLVERDLERKKLVRILPEIEPIGNSFRFVYQREDTRKPLFDEIARVLMTLPIA